MLDKINNFLSPFLQFSYVDNWEEKSSTNIEPVNTGTIELWIIGFIIIFIIGLYLLCNKRFLNLLDSISRKRLGISSVFIWLCGVIIYITGFYSSGVNGVSVILRAIISSFKMFVTAHDLARVTPILQNDATYMTAFSLIHFLAAFISALFVLKMVGYTLNSFLYIKSIRYNDYLKNKLNKFRKLIPVCITQRMPEGMKKHLRAWLVNKRVIHLFWGINEASCLLAEDIRRHQNHQSDTIIFIDIDEDSDDNYEKKLSLKHITNSLTLKNSEIARLDGIKDVLIDHCFNGPAVLNIKEAEDKEANNRGVDVFKMMRLRNIGEIVNNSNKAYFYFLSDDEVQNIVGALNLQKDKRLQSTGKKFTIYVHARRDANNEVYDHYSQYNDQNSTEKESGKTRCGITKIKIIDSAYLSVSKLMRKDWALPVNCVNYDTKTGLVHSPFTALIVGFGATGLEAFKFLYEFSTFIGEDLQKTPFKCYAIDQKINEKAGLLKQKMPGIYNKEISLVNTTVDSEEFWDLTKAIIGKLNYIVITINNDVTGLSLAVNLFKYALLRRDKRSPMLTIAIRCYDSNNLKRMEGVIDSLNNSLTKNDDAAPKIKIHIFGKEKDLYTCDTIISDDLRKEAKMFHWVYNKQEKSIEDQWDDDFGNKAITKSMNKDHITRYHAIYDINRKIAQNMSNAWHKKTKMTLMGLNDGKDKERLKKYHDDYVCNRKNQKTTYPCDEQTNILLRNMAILEHERWVASHKLMGYSYAKKSDIVRKLNKNLCHWNDLPEDMQSYDCDVVDTTIKIEYMNNNKQSSTEVIDS